MKSFSRSIVDEMICFDSISIVDRDEDFIYSSNKEFVEYLWNKTVEREWFNELNDLCAGRFAEILTRRGIGFTFNLLPADELLNLNV